MNKKLFYTLREEDLKVTADGLVNLVLKNCIRVTGHETSRAKYIPMGIAISEDGTNWQEIRVSERIRVGTILRVILPEDEDESKILPASGPLPDGSELHVLYEDEDLILIDKPAGIVVHPSPGHYADTMANYVAGYYAEKGQAMVCRIVGRLDKETSGALAFAKNRATAARLSRQRQSDVLVRTYYALVDGTFPPDRQRGVIDTAQESTPGVLMIRKIAKEGEGLHAVTHYEVIAQSQEASLLKLHIDTGRTHQIRLHMASIGHPLVGDTLYQNDKEWSAQDTGDVHVKSMPDGEERALLHAGMLTMQQPFTGETITVHSPFPHDFVEQSESRGIKVTNSLIC